MAKNILKTTVLFFLLTSSLYAQPKSSQIPDPAIRSMVEQAAQYQLQDFQHKTWGLQYRVHRVSPREDSIRQIIETADGVVSRTFTFHGKPLEPDAEQDELKRIRSLTPEAVRRREQKSESNNKYGIDLIRALPSAMIYTLAREQPQLNGVPHRQIVLDYVPNPGFRPASTVQSLLSGLTGRIWLDDETHHLIRIEVHAMKDLNLMFGILARIYKGGTVSYQQQPINDGHYTYTQIQMDVVLRELMLHVQPYHQTLTASDIHYFPAAPSLQEAIQTLTSMPPITH